MAVTSSSPPVVHSRSVQPSSVVAPVGDAGFEERWAAWRARGLQHDLALQRRMRWLSVIVAIAGTLTILSLIVLGVSW